MQQLSTGKVLPDISSNRSKKSAVWTEHKAGDNRVYYYNTVTRQSAWDKPDELKSPAEVSIFVVICVKHFTYFVWGGRRDFSNVFVYYYCCLCEIQLRGI